jgi:alpha-D-ribose 1-methylphosphonate 5-triphosphate synthase subunit PhnH
MIMDHAVLPGFADAAPDAQGAFRALLEAMSHPGRIVTVPAVPSAPPGVDAAMAALLLTLCDGDTPVWFDAAAAPAGDWLAFHTGAPRTESPSSASFAVVLSPATMPPLDAFNWGTDEVPEVSTTLLVQLPRLTDGATWRLRGPGIRTEAHLSVAGLSQDWFRQRGALAAAFPRGVDVVFTSGQRIAALPRTTILEA